jgi:toxin CcdB
MAQFDVYRFKPAGAKAVHVIDLQSDMLEGLATRIVAPLYPLEPQSRPILRLNPTVQVDGKAFYLATQELTAVRVKSLGKPVASLAEKRDELIAALDFLITGI